ncbi:MAG: Asp-tRNA(Asn)/Glu-tRNA(Gln) amidotransferase GatCAB subunit A, partial [Anaerolineae bacterium]|nr:Asp-tRNA(Asn)/Glu-tRNA(Gln) amidotransferase GatCAB subunit A [Anaerolineae bacterium]
MALYELTIREARALLRKGEISSVELPYAVLERIEALDSKVRAYLTVTPELALEQAKEADARRAAGEDAPLLGIPMAIKDVICTKGVETTCGSRILKGFVPP